MTDPKFLRTFGLARSPARGTGAATASTTLLTAVGRRHRAAGRPRRRQCLGANGSCVVEVQASQAWPWPAASWLTGIYLVAAFRDSSPPTGPMYRRALHLRARRRRSTCGTRGRRHEVRPARARLQGPGGSRQLPPGVRHRSRRQDPRRVLRRGTRPTPCGACSRELVTSSAPSSRVNRCTCGERTGSAGTC